MPLETDPVTLAFDNDGELIVATNLRFVTGTEAVALGIRHRILLFQGEWFLDLDAGMPWFTDIIGQKQSEAKARAALRRIILSTPGVAEITRLTAEFAGATRTLNISWEVRCEFGDTVSDTLQTSL